MSAILLEDDDDARTTAPSPAPSNPPPLPKRNRKATIVGVAPPAAAEAPDTKGHPSSGVVKTPPSPEPSFPPPQVKKSSAPPPAVTVVDKPSTKIAAAPASPVPERKQTPAGGFAAATSPIATPAAFVGAVGMLPVEPIVPRKKTPDAGALASDGALPVERIVPRRRTPAGGTAAAKTIIGGSAPPIEAPVVSSKPDPMVPPVIRVGSVAPKGRRTGSLLCEILLRDQSVTQEMVDKAIALQEERGGQIGRILVSLGACGEEAIARALLEQLRVRKINGYETDISVAARERKDVAGLKVHTNPTATILVLLVTDIASLVVAALLASSVHWVRTYSDLGEVDWSSWLVVGPSIALCLLTFLGLELFSPLAKSTPDEIRDITFSVTLVHFGASLISTLGDLPIVKWGVFVRTVWWLATLFLVPVVRSLVRAKLSTYRWWGMPVCVLGAAKTGRLIVRTLKAQPRSGLKPVMMLDDDPTKHGTLRASFSNEQVDVYSVNASSAGILSDTARKALAEDIFGGGTKGDEVLPAPVSSDHFPSAAEFLGPESQRKPKPESKPAGPSASWPRGKFAEVEGVPVIGDLALAPVLAQRLGIPYAVVAMPGVDAPSLVQIVERIGGKFSHLLIIPDLFGFATMGVPAKSLGGILGVEIRQQLLLPGPRLAKRVMDVALTGIGIFFVLPFLLLIAALIKLDSRGGIFYTQKRLGRDGTYFEAYKFRTMHGDGEARLRAILDADPQLRAEYEIYHKLKKDPRVTRVGRILRKFSLDEFPQLLNVIKGDMSLVGPRPYIERELTEMGGQEKIILRAPPGMTGMWQVSDRNATSFLQRVQIDVYYVRNWSPWLDIHILAKTFGVVIKGSGV